MNLFSCADSAGDVGRGRFLERIVDECVLFMFDSLTEILLVVGFEHTNVWEGFPTNPFCRKVFPQTRL